MKNSKFVFLCGAFIASAFTLGAYADDQANSAPAPAACGNDCLFKIENFGFSETLKAYNFNDDSDISQFDSTLTFTPSKEWNAHVTLPFFNANSTSAGMLEVGADFLVANNLCKFVDTFSVGMDFKLPTSSSDFGGDSVNTVLSADFAGKLGVADLCWKAGVSNEWVTDADYAPIFGGLVAGDIFNTNASIGHSFGDGRFCIAANYNYWNLEDVGSVNTIGPSMVIHFNSNFDLKFGWDIPFAEFDGSQIDDVFTVGASLKF